MSATASGAHLTPDSDLGDVLHHPAFAGFAPLLLPWHGRAYDEALTLRDVGTLLPYHSAVRPAVVVAAMNRMIDETAAGRALFHRCYDDAAIRLDASTAWGTGSASEPERTPRAGWSKRSGSGFGTPVPQTYRIHECQS